MHSKQQLYRIIAFIIPITFLIRTAISLYLCYINANNKKHIIMGIYFDDFMVFFPEIKVHFNIFMCVSSLLKNNGPLRKFLYIFNLRPLSCSTPLGPSTI
jgi:hypothetical protein